LIRELPVLSGLMAPENERFVALALVAYGVVNDQRSQ